MKHKHGPGQDESTGQCNFKTRSAFLEFTTSTSPYNIQQALLKSQRKKLQLYRKSIRHPPTHPSRLTYRRYRNIYNRLRKTAKREYFSNQLDKFKNNTRQTWNIYRQFLGKINDKTSITDYFVIDGKESNDKTVISEGFNNFFYKRRGVYS